MFRIYSQGVCFHFQIILGMRCQLNDFYIILYDVWIMIDVGTNMIPHDNFFIVILLLFGGL